MMNDLNSVLLEGRLHHDPYVLECNSGCVAGFTLSMRRFYKGKDGAYYKESSRIPVAVMVPILAER